MKKTFRSFLAILLCSLMIFSCSAVAFAEETEKTETTETTTVELTPEQQAARDKVANVGRILDSFFGDSGIDLEFNTAGLEVAEIGSGEFWGSFWNMLKNLFARFINMLSNLVINNILAGVLNGALKESIAVADYETFDLDSFEGFYDGTDTFLTEPAEGACWNLGYGEASIMPENFGEKSFAKGAYLPNVYGNTMYKDDDGTDEELRIRLIALNDGSGRGTTIIASVDAMGLCNADVRKIRLGIAEALPNEDIAAIEVSCTHIHTGIDSQGVWDDPLGSIVNNTKVNATDIVTGVDEDFLNAIIRGAKTAAKKAFADLQPGILKYSSTDISEYVHDRTAPIALDTNLYKLEFVPFEAEATPTILATFGCHPESSSYDWNEKVDENGETGYDTAFTADFVWYMEKVMNLCGYNFIYVQGNVGTVTSSRGLSNDSNLDFDAHESAVRYGYELGYIVLTMSMTTEERIAVNEKTGDRLGIAEHSNEDGYTVWYEDLKTVEAYEVTPLFNVANSQFTIQISNNAMAALGKTSVTDNFVLMDNDGKYYTVTEVGYMEIGTGEHSLKVYVSPGETFGELLLGGNGIAGFDYPALRETYGENLIIMDLMNDAAGYVANDANFVMLGLQFNEESGELDSDTWCIISYGKHTGSTLIGKFTELVENCKNS